MIEYNEKIYKRIGKIGTTNLILGIVLIVNAITIGTISIVIGGIALHAKKHLVG